MNLRAIIAILLVFVISGCNIKALQDDGGDDDRFIPRIPGGSIEDSEFTNVENFRIINDTIGQVTLKWDVPEAYNGVIYKIKIYKRDCQKGSSNCEIPDPTVKYTSADFYLLHETTSDSFTDTNITPSNFYTYWIYINFNSESWSSKIEEGVQAKGENIQATIPDASTFWSKKTWSYGQEEINGFVNMQTLTASHSISERKNPYVDLSAPQVRKSGGLAFGKDGNVMYVSDTENNRVVIYAKRDALACGENDGSVEYYACIFNNQGVPFSPVNVLGQRNINETGSCRTAAQCSVYGDETTCNNNQCSWSGSSCEPRLPIRSCLTSPTDLWVDNNNNLLIADSGNNRIVVHKDAPFDKGCDPEAVSGFITEVDCESDFVIGQRSRDEINSYTISSDGNRTINNPNGIFVKNDSLYIADTNNHRVVKLNNYDSYTCGGDDTSFWDTNSAQCNFNAVIGQETFFERINLFSEMQSGNKTINMSGLGNNLNDTDFLKRYFANPMSVRVDRNENLMVASYEGVFFPNGGNINEIRSRIMVFSNNPIGGATPSCNATNFYSGGCDADRVIGQQDFQSFLVYPNTGTYNDISYGLNFVSEFENVNDSLFAVTPTTNDVYIWDDWVNNSLNGVRYDKKVQDPNGSNGIDLDGISSIKFTSETLRLYLYDNSGSKIHEINLQ